jgi:thiamine pyrophosphokinase
VEWNEEGGAQMNKYDAVILANGEFPTAELPLKMLNEAAFLCCCDGAVVHVEHADAVVGDGDSLPSSLKERLGSKFVHVEEQEENDLTKATRHCLALGFRRLLYLGATGKREDHTLGNVSLMVEYMRRFGIQPTMMTDYGTFTPHHGDGDFDSFPGQQVSLFNFGCTVMQSQGLRYPVFPFGNWWQGTLNEALGNSFSLHADGDYLVYRTHQAKEYCSVESEPLHTTYLGLGTNQGDRRALLEQAISLIGQRVGRVVRRSSVIETEPWGFSSANKFLNMAVAVETSLSPRPLLEATQEIERMLGRQKKSTGGHYSDRPIDIDILLYDDLHIDEPDLTIPHPLMHEREFVMRPLGEILPSTCSYDSSRAPSARS